MRVQSYFVQFNLNLYFFICDKQRHIVSSAQKDSQVCPFTLYLHICGALTNNDEFSVILVLLSSILHKNTYKKYTQTGLFQPPMRIHVVHKCILVRKYCVTKSHIIVTYIENNEYFISAII